MKRFYHRKSTKKLYRDWKMTEDQHGAYFRLLESCYHALGVTSSAEKEEARQIIHYRAFKRPGVSAKAIDKLKMFDDFKAACLAIIKPNDVDAQLKQANMGSIRLIYRINELAPEIYWRAEAKRKFGHDNLDLLSVANLTILRDHLCARAIEIVWPKPAGDAMTDAMAQAEHAEAISDIPRAVYNCPNCGDVTDVEGHEIIDAGTDDAWTEMRCDKCGCACSPKGLPEPELQPASDDEPF